MTAPPSRLPSADPWRRLMGGVYEAVILFGVLWFADYAFSALTQFRGHPGALRTAFQWFTLAVLAVYFVGFWSSGRRSLPMKTMSLLLVSHDGGAVSPGRALLRFAAATLLLVGALAAGRYLHGSLYALLLLPYAWTFVDRERRALYDLIAGTRLVHAPVAPAMRSVDV
ncbi:MAG: RDD family protein [Burkholderiaceae bacterium]